jgi:hypothetical protein
MQVLHHRVEDATGLQQAQHLSQELGQVPGLGEAAVHVGNDLEFSQPFARILPQELAGKIPYTVSAEDCCMQPPLVRPAILYGHRDRAHPANGQGALFSRSRVFFECLVVSYGLPVACSDIELSV